MKSTMFSLFAALALGLSASAQSIQFLQPADGASLTPGQNFSIQIGQPMQLSGFENAAITFAYEACGTNGCPNVAAPNAGVGDPLETFVFAPQLSGIPWIPPNQNFTIEFPKFAQGKGVLSATLFYFGSAALVPMFTVSNITVNAA